MVATTGPERSLRRDQLAIGAELAFPDPGISMLISRKRSKTNKIGEVLFSSFLYH
jgi:hypothetical protein